VSNGVLSAGELGFVAMVVTLVWQHPYVTLVLVLVALAGLLLLVRYIWRTLRQALGRERRSSRAS
jgi:membrane protein implicated in regulation of membrane protease activity